MGATGFVTLDFGTGANEASASFADTGVGAASKVDAFFMSDTTADHTANDHRYAGLFIALSCEAQDGVGGVVYAHSTQKMTGTFKARWVWVD